MTKDEALDLALEALESVLANHNGAPVLPWIEARDAIKQALAAPVQEPVAWYRDEDGIRIYYESKVWDDATPLYTTPPAQPAPKQKRPQNCGTGYCSCVECVMEPAPVQEPVAWWNGKYGSPVFAFERDTPGIGLGNPDATPLYTTPPAAQRQWVGLTDEEIDKHLSEDAQGDCEMHEFARAIEAKLKEKNT